ncbi:DUF1852 domain-containing protein [Pantoea sp. 1.19]|uniref:DUF1852 domain-containing protein n=1 Tax=Pantoea sp. 1.19 TaxID=1925589 RepID=UPI0009490EA7|nr:DUF1852 domain-containing protein [Pantoea sp. 1.19]
MNNDVTFTLKRTLFDENYNPAENTRTTTNFANLARGKNRQQNLRNALVMMNTRFNALARWDNPQGDRYALELDIISVDMHIRGNSAPFPVIEVLHNHILDRHSHQRIEGIVGNNFSSYVRDYDFSIVLPAHNKNAAHFSLPEGFGNLHGHIFQQFVNAEVYKTHFRKQPVICLSVSSKNTYCRTDNVHPVLGVEYQQDDLSLTDEYFHKMGLQVRFFMPPDSVAPLAFYFKGDLLNDYSNLELIGTISTMETFQKIYRPEIYNANAAAGKIYQPSLNQQNYSLTRVVYDREERSQLAIEQGKYTEEHFINPWRTLLAEWSAERVL